MRGQRRGHFAIAGPTPPRWSPSDKSAETAPPDVVYVENRTLHSDAPVLDAN